MVRRRGKTRKKKGGPSNPPTHKASRCNHGCPELNDQHREVLRKALRGQIDLGPTLLEVEHLELSDAEVLIQKFYCMATDSLLSRIHGWEAAWGYIMQFSTEMENAKRFAKTLSGSDDELRISMSIEQSAALMFKRTHGFQNSKKDTVVYLDRKIPCNCLADLKQQILAEKEKNACRNCANLFEDMLYCPKCKIAQYCSRDCQVADWPEHKAKCRIWAG